MFGINAVGKDTIAKMLKSKHPSVFITTESRLLMYHLGIISDFAADSTVTEADYKKLENTPQSKIIPITNGPYRESLKSFETSNRITLLLSHLVFILHIGKKPIFLNQKDPPFPELSTGLIQIKASYGNILNRRAKDNADGTRMRYSSQLELLQKHQMFCDQKWAKITLHRDPNTYITVINKDLETAVQQIDDFIWGRLVKLKHE